MRRLWQFITSDGYRRAERIALSFGAGGLLYFWTISSMCCHDGAIILIGQVQTMSSQPLPGARVELFHVTTDGTSFRLMAVRSDSAGCFYGSKITAPEKLNLRMTVTADGYEPVHVDGRGSLDVIAAVTLAPADTVIQAEGASRRFVPARKRGFGALYDDRSRALENGARRCS